MSHSPVINYGQDEIPHLRSQNDQLWKIIEKQRVMIQNLQKDNVRLSAERDGLQDQISSLEKELVRKQRVASLVISPQALREIAEADDASTPTPSSDSPVEAFSFIVPTSSPMPPPRSPYRPLKEKSDDYIKEPFESESFIRNMDDMNGRSSPGSPAPGPHYHQPCAKRKDSAPLPSPSTRTQSPFIVPSPSKSSSSLEVRRNNIARQRDSMMPPVRAALEHDPSMRAASPPVPFRSSTSRNAKRESTIFSTSRTDLSMDESAFDEEIRPDLSQKQQFIATHLARVSVKVVGSNIKPNEKGKEVVSFILSVGTLDEEDTKLWEERWRVEKFYSDFLGLDAKLKTQRSRTTSSRVGKLPDKALFSNNAPTKVDQRKIALEQYLQHAIASPLEDTYDICEFLSTNVVDNKIYQPVGQIREGYLTKRGKNFGGWKTRYFILNESKLEYFESKEGTQLGSIRLTNAQIGSQMPGSSQASEEYNSVYRHAFLIVEQKRVGSTHYVRHILCANSDDDRDDWVQALLENVHIEDDPIALSKSTSTSSSSSKKKKEEKPRKLSKGEIRAISATPISHLKLDSVANADMEKLTSVPSMDDHNIGMALSSKPYSRPTPSVSSESTDSTNVSNSLPSVNATWSSSPYDQVVRTSLDQSSHNNHSLQAPRPAIVRRSSMGNLISSSTEQQLVNEDFLNPHQYNRALSPTIPTLEETEPEKKARNKAHRMTFWGKKMLFSNTDGQQNQQQTAPPKLSQSTSATTSSSDISKSTTNSASNSSSGGGLRGFLSRSSHEQNDRSRGKYIDDTPLPKPPKQVFGVSLEEAVRISRVSEGYELPAVVYRCIEYLDAMDAVLEEGLYRLSGSNSTMKALREKFNQEGDVNLMAAKDDYDVHVVAGLLKMWLRELPTSVLTREHRMDFLHVIDLLDRKDRVNELGRLVSVLPLPNYTLLRALTAHLIRVVQHSDINKMTMRNVSIVFSPTLGIPATIFNLFMSEFEYIFWTTEDGDAAPRMIFDEPEEVTIVVQQEPISSEDEDEDDDDDNENDEEVVEMVPQENQAPLLSRKTTLRLREEHGRSNRNSVNYMDGAPNAIVDLEKNMDGPPVLDEDEDEDVDDLTLSTDTNYQPHLYAQQT